ncbi:MAG: sulfotransferase domain-containing protein [Gammaproteobacteria bacterium]|nr:sulfotransferase domain-containing protein [Gammaproteobacteria bacterium]
MQARKLLWQQRARPDFIIIGAQKSGTTSLYSWLARHPQIRPSFVKEVHFFDGGLDPAVDSYQKGEPWYRAQFPLRRSLQPDKLTFEASPLYLFNPLTARRIYDWLPEIKLIAVLRNPTERAISHYFHMKRRDREPLAIADALRAEQGRLAQVIAAKDFKNERFIHNSYKSRGLYRVQLERYFELFQRQQILVLESETLFAEPTAVLRTVFEFLEVDSGCQIGHVKPHNVGSNRSQVDGAVYDYLDQYYCTHNQALYQLVGTDYGW